MQKKHKKRTVRWNRIFILLATVVMMLTFTCQALGDSDFKEIPYEKVVVANGDSLWGLIKEYNGNIKNMGKAVYEVQEVNNLDNASIYVGQVINMPTNLK